MLQVIVNGAISGLVLGCLALGFSTVYLPCRVFHIALGGIYALAPYTAMALRGVGASWPLALGGSVTASVLLALACELGNHRWLDRKRASAGAQMISSLGIYIILVQVTAIIWGNETQVLRAGIDKVFRLGSVVVTLAQVISACVSGMLLFGVYTWLRLSRLGLRLRALADNQTEFALLGFNVDRHRVLAFALSGFLAGTTGLLTAYDVGFDPHGGLHMLLLAVVAAIIGGLGNFRGPIIGGMLLGVLRSGVVWYLSARWQDVVTFCLLALFLYVRPNGLFARRMRLEAEA